MRKNREKPYGSPKFKLQLKSSTSKPKLKISSPFYSPRSIIKKQPKIAKIQQSECKLKTVWLPNPTLYSFINPLQKLETTSLNFSLSISSKNNGQKIWVISSIDFFIDTYMQLNEQLKVQCQRWFIISNAMNSQQTQTEFNKLYSPIQFSFLPSISNVCNFLLNFSQNKAISEIKTIYDLSLAFSNNCMCIEDVLIQNITNPMPNCLYIISDAKQWMLLATKINKKLIPYFVTGNQQFRDGKFIIYDLKQKKDFQIFYVLFQFQKNIFHLKGFQQHELNFIRNVNSKYMSTTHGKSQIYISKLIEKLLIQNKQIIIFYEPISKSSLLNIQQIRQRLNSKLYLLEYKYYKQANNCYKLRWGNRIRSCQQFSINSAVCLGDQIKKIEQFIQKVQEIEKQYRGNAQKLKKMQIIMYDKDNLPNHCISQALKKVNIKISIINDLANLYETHKITIIYGHLNFNEIKSLNNFYNVFVVPISKQAQQTAAFNQINEAIEFLQTGMKAYQQLYCQMKTQPVQAYVHALYQSQTDIASILQSLNISENLLKIHFIPKFSIALKDFRQFSKHLIIADMNSFSEDIEIMIRQIQWRWNTINIQIYLKYGQEFILRNKEGNYKFIKAVELQSKINQLEQYCKIQESAPNKNIPEPTLQILSEVENMMGNEAELDNLIPEQSIVELYVDKNQIKSSLNIDQRNTERLGENNEYYATNNIPKESIINNTQQNQNKGSIIQLLNENMLKQKQKSIIINNSKADPENNYLQISKSINSGTNKNTNKKQNMLQFLGEQTMQLLDLQNLPSSQKNMIANKIKSNQGLMSISESSLSIKIVKQPENKKVNRNDKLQREDKKLDTNAVRNVSKNKKNIQKGAYIKQYKQQQHSPLKTPIPDHDQLTFNNYGSNNFEIYQLYIFIHRSVPHHSLARRQSKEYHILVYTKIQEVFAFARYLKPQQKIIIVANQQSAQVYSQLFAKSKISQDKLTILFAKDLSQNFIRRQIDSILSNMNLGQVKKQNNYSKKFKSLIVYSANNERVMKSIKIIKKIFGTQLKIVFLKQKQYQQMIESKYGFKIKSDINIYKIGLSVKKNELQLSSIRNIFILAMHPDLKSPQFDFSQLQFSYEPYVGRLIYGKQQKNYVTTSQKTKGKSDSFRKKIQSIKSQSNLLIRQQSRLSFMKAEYNQRRRSQTPLHSTMSRSSTILQRQSSKINIAISYSLKQSYPSKNSFSTENGLYNILIASNSLSKLSIVVITEKQFDIFQVFQKSKYQQLTKSVVWIIQTKTQGKKLFVSLNIIYCLIDQIGDAIQNVLKQYQNQLYFDSLKIQSGLQGIKGGLFAQRQAKVLNSQISKALNILVLPNAQLVERQLSNPQTSKQTLIIAIQKQSKTIKKYFKNVIYFPNLETIKMFVESLSGIFLGKPQLGSFQSFGSLVYVPQTNLQMIIKASDSANIKNIIFKSYEMQNLWELISYSIFRTLIIIDKQNSRQLQSISFTIPLEKNQQKMSKLLAATLL